MSRDNSFVGIDLAWNTEGRHSGVAVFRGDERAVTLAALSTDLQSRSGVVAIDASLVVTNDVGQRERE
jgi:predicted RNase H-like nuclease